MAKDNNILSWFNGKKMYLGTALFFLAQAVRALNPIVIAPLTGFVVPEPIVKVVEEIGIGLGVIGATHKVVKEHQN